MAGSEEPSRRGQLGDFEVDREIGGGGMGIVYEARQVTAPFLPLRPTTRLLNREDAWLDRSGRIIIPFSRQEVGVEWRVL